MSSSGFGLWRSVKRTVRNLALRKGYFIGRCRDSEGPETPASVLSSLLSILSINCVLDVGAHRGEYAESLRDLGYQGRIVSFEPVPEHFAALAEREAGDPNWRGFAFALGADEGAAQLHVTRSSTFASLYAPSDYGKERFARDMNIVRDEPVAVRRLENVFDECVAGIAEPHVLLKVDTQGGDMAVIAGAGARLAQVSAVQVELAVKQIYSQTTNYYLDAIARLRGLGFELASVAPVARDPLDRLRIVELDCVFCRGRTDGVA